jgi:hypothetical protein
MIALHILLVVEGGARHSFLLDYPEFGGALGSSLDLVSARRLLDGLGAWLRG